jgi:hypothetical protein
LPATGRWPPTSTTAAAYSAPCTEERTPSGALARTLEPRQCGRSRSSRFGVLRQAEQGAVPPQKSGRHLAKGSPAFDARQAASLVKRPFRRQCCSCGLLGRRLARRDRDRRGDAAREARPHGHLGELRLDQRPQGPEFTRATFVRVPVGRDAARNRDRPAAWDQAGRAGQARRSLARRGSRAHGPAAARTATRPASAGPTASLTGGAAGPAIRIG